MSYHKLLKQKLALETELAEVNEKLKAKATSGSSELIKVKGLELNIAWVDGALKFDRKKFERDNPTMVKKIRAYCTVTGGHHRMGKVKEVA